MIKQVNSEVQTEKRAVEKLVFAIFTFLTLNIESKHTSVHSEREKKATEIEFANRVE